MVIGFVVVGCFRVLPPHFVMEENIQNFEPDEPDKDGYALIYVTRPYEPPQYVFRFPVKIGKKSVGSVMDGEHVFAYVKPGKHKVCSYSGSDRACNSVDVSSGDRVYLRQVPGFFRLLKGIDQERLDDVAGRYSVMNTGLGKMKD